MNALLSADLFRAVAVAQSTETTRYYLCGVYVEPHPHLPGVILVATDGHRMVVAHDPAGSVDVAGVIALPPDLLKQCKRSGRGQRRLIEVNDGIPTILELKHDNEIESHKATLAAGVRVPVATGVRNCIVDGTFPDWRRVVPNPAGKPCSPVGLSFNANYLGDFAKVCAALADYNTGRANPATIGAPISLYAEDDGGPALIRFGAFASAFGVLMPLRHNVDRAELPPFMAPAKTSATAIAA